MFAETTLSINTSLALLAKDKDQPEEYARILGGAEEEVIEAWVDWVVEKDRANQPAEAILNGTTAGATTTGTATEDFAAKQSSNRRRNELRASALSSLPSP